ncbi:MAG: NAD(P)(+) transhydrogenase (Re/Si-specific) subunit beta, partial [Rhodospirillales bacterium]
MAENLTGFAYLIAAVLFILALRGLSNPESARMGNIFGMVGMAIAVITTLLSPGVVSYWMIILGILIGGGIGTAVALKIQMTQLPELVAAFHSLVGLAAVFVATAAFYHPEAYNIGTAGNISAGSLIEMALGTAIGAITFSGSVIAFLKLAGKMSGNPITFPMQHPLNAAIGILILLSIIWFCTTESAAAYWVIV